MKCFACESEDCKLHIDPTKTKGPRSANELQRFGVEPGKFWPDEERDRKILEALFILESNLNKAEETKKLYHKELELRRKQVEEAKQLLSRDSIRGGRKQATLDKWQKDEEKLCSSK